MKRNLVVFQIENEKELFILYSINPLILGGNKKVTYT